MPKIPPIRKSLEYTVELRGKKIIKKPNVGFEFKVETDVARLKKLGSIAPRTKYIKEHNIIEQQAIKGRFAKSSEIKKVRREIKKRGYIPRGIIESDVIITSRRHTRHPRRLGFKVIDVGQFERR